MFVVRISWEDERMDRSDPASGASGHLLNFLRQNGLALPKPWGSKEEARQGIARAAALIKGILPGGVACCKVRQRAKDNANCRVHRKRKRLKKRLPPAKRRKSGEGRKGGNHTTCCNTSSRIPGTRRSGAVRANTCPFPLGASLNTGFHTPFLRSLMLITCERTSSAGTMKTSVSSPSRKRTLSFVAKTLPQGRKLFPNFPSSRDLDWRTVKLVLLRQNELFTSWRIPSS